MAAPAKPDLPKRVQWFAEGFRRHYALRFVRKHFHAVRISLSGSPIPSPEIPVLVVLNHPAWWDPLIGTVFSLEFGDREHFAAIDADMARKYGFFKYLGFFGVDTETLSGARAFLKTGSLILSAPKRVLWVTAQGRFADVRTRPLDLRSGVGHLAARMTQGVILPVALEYAFWTERTPEALIRVGEPLKVAQLPHASGKEWTQKIEKSLSTTLDQLNREVESRDPNRFRIILGGRTGTGGAYDWWQRVNAAIRFRKYQPEHMTEGKVRS
jgi:1-acyl-sn-glycerol-3-phosphate acyltransferase